MHFVIFFAGRLCFHFIEALTVGFAIYRIKSKNADVTVGFFGYSLWKVLTIFQRCMIAKNDLQIFFLPNNFFMQQNIIALVGVCLFL